MSTEITSGPFPVPVDAARQQAWIEAVLATEGVNLPRGALENVAPFLVDPEDTLSEPDAQGVRTLKESAVRRIRTDAGEMLIALVRMHGVGGVPWGHNERISSIWRSVADPSVDGETSGTLTPVRAWERAGEVRAALESVVRDRAALLANTEDAADALAARDRVRPYDLEEDLVLNGQQEPGMYVPQEVKLADDAACTRSYWGWMAVRGNNRTHKRHSIFRVSSGEVLAGLPAEKVGHGGGGIIDDPHTWLTAFSSLLNREYAESPQEDVDPTTGTRAQRARAIAVVDAHLVIGTPTPERLYRIVQMNNRRDHVHPPLEFEAIDRSRALGRSVLGMYVARRVLDEKVAQVLSGLAPIRELPEADGDMNVSELRDLRSMRLLQELFPVDQHKRLLLRRALSESPPSQLSAKEIHQRARTWSALTSESYPQPWNPRIGEVFSTSARNGITLSGRRLPELLAAAEHDDAAFEELVAYRAAHWLAAFDIIEPDRGSLDGQQVLGAGGQMVRRSRRTVTNCLQALRHEKARPAAVGLLRALVAAMDDGDRPPYRVSQSGMETPGREMDAAWFDGMFPKETGTRPRKSAAAPAPPPARSVPVPAARAGDEGAPAALAVQPRTGAAGTAAPSGWEPAELSFTGEREPTPSAPSPGDDLLVRAEERVVALHRVAGEVVDLLNEVKGQGGSPSEETVRLLGETAARLREVSG